MALSAASNIVFIWAIRYHVPLSPLPLGCLGFYFLMMNMIKLFDLPIKGFDIRKRVYSINGISPTLNAGMGLGGGCVPWLLIDAEDE